MVKNGTFCKVKSFKSLNLFNVGGTAKPLFPGSSPGASKKNQLK